MPYINNEKQHDKSTQYKQRFMSLNRLQLYLTEADAIVFPKQSEHFGEMGPNGPIEGKQTKLYTEDWIGLKTIDEQHKVWWTTFPGGHTSFDSNQVQNNFIPFLYRKDWTPSSKEEDMTFIQ